MRRRPTTGTVRLMTQKRFPKSFKKMIRTKKAALRRGNVSEPDIKTAMNAEYTRFATKPEITTPSDAKKAKGSEKKKKAPAKKKPKA